MSEENLDLLLWYKEVFDKDAEGIWKANFVHIGILSTIPDPDNPTRENYTWYVVDNYKLLYQPVLKERLGWTVGIKGTEPMLEHGYYVVKQDNYVFIEDNNQ